MPADAPGMEAYASLPVMLTSTNTADLLPLLAILLSGGVVGWVKLRPEKISIEVQAARAAVEAVSASTTALRADLAEARAALAEARAECERLRVTVAQLETEVSGLRRRRRRPAA